jgi:hypothetical protein
MSAFFSCLFQDKSSIQRNHRFTIGKPIGSWDSHTTRWRQKTTTFKSIVYGSNMPMSAVLYTKIKDLKPHGFFVVAGCSIRVMRTTCLYMVLVCRKNFVHLWPVGVAPFCHKQENSSYILWICLDDEFEDGLSSMSVQYVANLKPHFTIVVAQFFYCSTQAAVLLSLYAFCMSSGVFVRWLNIVIISIRLPCQLWDIRRGLYLLCFDM